MPTRLVCRRHPSRPTGAGWFSTMGYGTRPQAVSTAWDWLCSIWNTRRNACCGAIPGSSDRRPNMRSMATSTTLSSPADIQFRPTATLSTFITEPRIAPSPWLEPACALYWIGWTPMDVANAVSERRICEAADAFSVYLWLPAPSPQPRVHHQTSHLPGLLRLRPRI